jgi:dUTP pyrophosphatase
MLRVKKLVQEAKLPVRGSEGAAGYDLSSTGKYDIEPGCRGIVNTGIAIELPEGTYGRIAPRSGLAVKKGIQVGAGVVDADYRGELKVVLFNHDKSETFHIEQGDRIAQLVLEKIACPEVEEISEDLETTTRGDGGFGSTGVAEKASSEH